MNGDARHARRPRVLVALCVAAAASLASAQEQVAVVASRSGFKPATLNLRKGETVRLELTTSDEEHCFAVDAFRVEKRISPGRVTRLDLTPDRAGTFPFYCCLEPGAAAQRGRLVVSE